MKCNFIIKILLLLIFVSLSGCNSTKKVPEGSFLLRKNDISINNKKPKTHHVYSYLRQEPNSRILGIPLGLLIYNLADDHAEENTQKSEDKPSILGQIRAYQNESKTEEKQTTKEQEYVR